jgi:hypothetical protein
LRRQPDNPNQIIMDLCQQSAHLAPALNRSTRPPENVRH